MTEVDEDPIEKAIGRFGRYQIFVYLLITVSRLPAEFQATNVVFVIPSVNYVCLDEQSYNQTNVCPCSNPKYDQTDISSSVTSEWNLICERESLASLTQSIMQVGFLAGSVFYGFVSDRFGRKHAVILALFTDAFFSTLSAIVPEFWMFFVLRFFIGSATGGTIICSFIMCIELCGKSFRQYMMVLIEVAFVSGYSLLPMFAFFLRDWRHLQLAISVPWLSVILLYWLLPESPRWLIATGRKEEAVTLLSCIAKRNGRPVENIEQIVNEADKQSMISKEQKSATYLDLFRTPKMRLYSVVSAIVWGCCTGLFYGVMQFIGHLGGNLHLNVFITAISHLPGLTLLLFATLYFNRKTTIIGTFSVAGISFLIMIFVENVPSASLALATIGQIATYASFMQVYLICCEIFPTVVRNSAMSFGSVFGRIGGFVAPFVVNIGIKWITLLVFICFAAISVLLCIFLPETKNTTLPHSIEQIESRHKKDIK